MYKEKTLIFISSHILQISTNHFIVTKIPSLVLKSYENCSSSQKKNYQIAIKIYRPVWLLKNTNEKLAIPNQFNRFMYSPKCVIIAFICPY